MLHTTHNHTHTRARARTRTHTHTHTNIITHTQVSPVECFIRLIESSAAAAGAVGDALRRADVVMAWHSAGGGPDWLLSLAMARGLDVRDGSIMVNLSL